MDITACSPWQENLVNSEETHGSPQTVGIMIESCTILSNMIDYNALKIDFVKFTLENVLACRCLLYALKRLKNNRALSYDTPMIIFKIFKTATVSNFLNFIIHWKSSLNFFFHSHQQPTYGKFVAWVKKSTWTEANDQGSIFRDWAKNSTVDLDEMSSYCGDN